MIATQISIVRNRPFRMLTRVEFVLFLRSPAAVVWTALIPLITLIVLGSVPATRHVTKILHGSSYLATYLPILMVFALCMSAVNALPPALATYREKGILRRLSTTPVPPSRLLAAQACVYLGVGIAVDLLLLTIGVSFGVPAPGQPLGFVVSLLLVAIVTLGIGLLISAVAPNGRVANAVSMMMFFLLMFFAGLWLPQSEMPPILRTISELTPLGAGVRAVHASVAGHWPTGESLVVMVVYALVCGAIAVRLFRWE